MQTTPVLSSPLIDILERVHRDFASDADGEVATYIPELGAANLQTFGIAVATVDGEVFSACRPSSSV